MSNSEKIYVQLDEISKLYEQIKQVILDAEYANGNNSYNISPVNEVRNAFDHIMKSFLNQNINFDKEYEKAKGHLYRSGFDAYEIIAIFKLNEIESVRKSYKLESITTGYPDYFAKFIPLTTKIKNKLSHARGNKMVTDIEQEKSAFEQYRPLVVELIEIVDQINLHLPGIQLVENEIKRKNKIEIIKNFLFGGLGISLVILLIDKYVLK